MDSSHAVFHGSVSQTSRSSYETQKKNDSNDQTKTWNYPTSDQAPIPEGVPPNMVLTEDDRLELLKRFHIKELLGMTSETTTNPSVVHVTDDLGSHANKHELERGNSVYAKRWTLLPGETGYVTKPLPGKVSADEQHFTVWPLRHPFKEGYMKHLETSPLGQRLYAHGYKSTSQGTQRFDGTTPYEKQPDIKKALKEIDKLSSVSSEGLLKLRMRGGAGEKKKVHWGALPNPFMSNEKKFEKALEAWIAKGRENYPAIEREKWNTAQSRLKDSFSKKVLYMPLGIPERYLKEFTRYLGHVSSALVNLDSADIPLSVLENMKGLQKLIVQGEKLSINSSEEFPLLRNLQTLKLWISKSISDKSLETIAKCTPKLTELRISGLKLSAGTSFSFSAVKNFTCLERLDLEEMAVSNDDVSALSEIENLEMLVLQKTLIDDNAAPHFMNMKNLRQLSVANTSVSDEVIRAVASLPKIDVLNISGTRMSNEALSHLANCSLRTLVAIDMKNACKIDNKVLRKSRQILQTLRLDNTSMSNVSITYLSKFKNLSDLCLEGNAVTDASICSLEGLPLTKLVLLNPAISDAAAKTIGKLTRLEECAISGANVSDAFLSAFTKMKDLTNLSLDDAWITDDGIRQWAEYLSDSSITTLSMNYTLITDEGLATLLTTCMDFISVRASQVRKLPDELIKLLEDDEWQTTVDLRDIEFDASTLETLRTLDAVEYDDPDAANSDDDDGTSGNTKKDEIDTPDHWKTKLNLFDMEEAGGSTRLRAQSQASYETFYTYLSYTEEVKMNASVGIEMAAMRYGQIDAQMREIYPYNNCKVYYGEAIARINRGFSLAKDHGQGVGNYSVKMDIQTPGAAITNVIDVFGAQVPGIGVMTSSVNQVAEAYGIRNFNRWAEGVSRKLDAHGSVDMFADTLARAMTLWYKDDLNDSEWVKKNSEQKKFPMQVQDYVKGIGQGYTEHEQHIMHLVERKLNWLFKHMGRLADENAGSKTAKKGRVNLAEAIEASIEAERDKLDKLDKRRGKQKQTDAQSVGGRPLLVDTDHLKILPIMEALVKKFPRSRQDTLPPDSLRQELAKLIVWGKRDLMIPWSDVNERTMQKLAKSGSSNLSGSTLVLTEEPQSMEEQGQSVLQLTVARQNATIEEQSSIIAKQQKSIETLENTVAELQKQMEAILKILPGKPQG